MNPKPTYSGAMLVSIRALNSIVKELREIEYDYSLSPTKRGYNKYTSKLGELYKLSSNEYHTFLNINITQTDSPKVD